MYQGKFSNNYKLVLQRGVGDCWIAKLIGPKPAEDQCVSSGGDVGLEAAKIDAFGFGIRNVHDQDILDNQVQSLEQLKWSD